VVGSMTRPPVVADRGIISPLLWDQLLGVGGTFLTPTGSPWATSDRIGARRVRVNGDLLMGAEATDVKQRSGQIHAEVHLPSGVDVLIDLLATRHGQQNVSVSWRRPSDG
jgi:hypothetical protein